jgi:K+-sensing histidine kinase KdpD
MERILVGINSHHSAWEAFYRACALANRIEAKLHVLLVLSNSMDGRHPMEQEQEATLRTRLELLIEKAKSDGIQVNYFIAEGPYEEAVIRFVDHHRITLLVYELPEGQIRSGEKGLPGLSTIRHRISCKVELVAPKTNQQEKIT